MKPEYLSLGQWSLGDGPIQALAQSQVGQALETQGLKAEGLKEKGLKRCTPP